MRPFTLLLLTILAMSCQTREEAARRQPDSAERGKAVRKYSQITLREDSPYPNVGISTYTLITDDAESRRGDAEAIMRRKIEWPRAMQTKDEFCLIGSSRGILRSEVSRSFTGVRNTSATGLEMMKWSHRRNTRIWSCSFLTRWPY